MLFLIIGYIHHYIRSFIFLFYINSSGILALEISGFITAIIFTITFRSLWIDDCIARKGSTTTTSGGDLFWHLGIPGFVFVFLMSCFGSGLEQTTIYRLSEYRAGIPVRLEGEITEFLGDNYYRLSDGNMDINIAIDNRILDSTSLRLPLRVKIIGKKVYDYSSEVKVILIEK
jgi:uncharacterized protein YdeI (BOF family)